jgi:hypothetical protein
MYRSTIATFQLAEEINRSSIMLYTQLVKDFIYNKKI